MSFVTVGSEPFVIANERLYLTADRDRVVAAGDPDAAVLFATPGKRIPRVEAERLGLLEVDVPAADTEEPDEPEPTSTDESDDAVAVIVPPASKRSRGRG